MSVLRKNQKESILSFVKESIAGLDATVKPMLSVEEIKEDMRIRDDCGLDSLDFYELAEILESHYEISFSDDWLDAYSINNCTVAEIVSEVEKFLAQKEA